MLLPLRDRAVKYYIDVTTLFLMPKALNDNTSNGIQTRDADT